VSRWATHAIAAHRATRLARFVARASRRYLDAYGNRDFGTRTNGEEWALAALGPHALATVFDVGAHRGEYARMVLAANPAARVHCFEADPTRARALSTELARDTTVVVNPFGLGSREEAAMLLIDEASGDMSSLVFRADLDRRSVPVEIRTGDRYCREHGVPGIDLLKVDTEGFDLEVLRGFSEMLHEQRVAVVQFEYTIWNIHSRALLLDFYEMLEPLGYRIGKLRPHGVEFTGYAPVDEDFLGPNCMAVLECRTDLLDALRGDYR